jgi:hypothetical protein
MELIICLLIDSLTSQTLFLVEYLMPDRRILPSILESLLTD